MDGGALVLVDWPCFGTCSLSDIERACKSDMYAISCQSQMLLYMIQGLGTCDSVKP